MIFKIAIAAAALFALAAAPANADVVGRHGMSPVQYQQTFDGLSAQGYHVTRVSGYATPQGMRYAAIWRRDGSNYAVIARHGMSAPQYQAEFNQQAANGFRLTDVSVADGGNFAAIWVQRGGPASEARHGLDGPAYNQYFQEMSAKGFRLTTVSSYMDANGVPRFACIWVQNDGRGWYSWNGMSSQEYQQKFDSMVAQGYRPVHIDGYYSPSGPRFAAIFEQKPGAFVARHNMTSADYQQQFDMNAANGYTISDVTGYWDGSQVLYAAIWTK